MLGPWHLGLFDGAIDRERWVRRNGRWRAPSGPRPVTIWQSRVMTGPHVLWPPVHADDQREYARRIVAAKHEGGAVITVLRRRGATCVIVLDVFGVELTEYEQHRVRRELEWLKPRNYFTIRPWCAFEVGPRGGFTTNAVHYERDPNGWPYDDTDRRTPALARLERIQRAADDELEAAS
jgi:hypothetical protein